MTYALEARDVGRSFPGVRALDGVSLAVRPGAVHAVVGENGAGKSTLMKILSGVYSEYDGEVFVRGDLAHFASPRDAEAAGVAIIHQELNLVPALSVAENVFLGREPTRFGFVDARRARRETETLLARLGHAIDPSATVARLRIGDRQIVEIAKALSLDADVLVMDEPTTALASDDVERLFAIVRTLAGLGKAIVYISHKLDELFRIAEEFTVLRDGRLVGARLADATSPAELVTMMVGREIPAATRRDVVRVEGPALLDVRDLGADAHGDRALDGVSFRLDAGEILGVGGLMGSGRTELLECLFGARRVTVGTRVSIAGEPVRLAGPLDAIRRGLALVPEDRKGEGLILDQSVAHNVTLATLSSFARLGFVDASAEREAASAAASKLGVRAPKLSAAVANLSGGNQQKVVLAKWLMTTPRVLLLDEPTKGIDVAAKAEIYAIVRELAASGMGVVFVSSELPELLALADRILVLCEGRLAGELDAETATEERILELATTVASARVA